MVFLFIIEAIGVLKPAVPHVVKLPVQSGSIDLGTGFKVDGAYSNTDRADVPRGITVYGSWLGSDTNTGTAVTAWYAPVATFDIEVAGYPNSPKLSIVVQSEDVAGHQHIVTIEPGNPGEVWERASVSLPNAETVKRFRLIAKDDATSLRGWMGFSEPFTIDPGDSLPLLGKAGVASMSAAAILAFLTGILCALAAWNKRIFPSLS